MRSPDWYTTQSWYRINGQPMFPVKDKAAQTRAVNQLTEHMVDISDDPSGSDPADYLSPDDVSTLERFMAKANESAADHLAHWPRDAQWPSSVPIEMHRPILPWPAAASDPRNIGTNGLRQVLIFRKKGSHKGYIFGHLSAAPNQPVAICDDGLLRSYRGPELPHSKASGWGRLPDPKYLKPALRAGQIYGVTYSNRASRDLEQILKAEAGGLAF